MSRTLGGPNLVRDSTAGGSLRYCKQVEASVLVLLISRKMSILAAVVVFAVGSVLSLETKNSLPSLNNLAAWTVLGTFTNSPTMFRNLTLASTNDILGIPIHIPIHLPKTQDPVLPRIFRLFRDNVDGLFLSAFTCNLLLWIDVETAIRQPLNLNGSTEKWFSLLHRRCADSLVILVLCADRVLWGWQVG